MSALLADPAEALGLIRTALEAGVPAGTTVQTVPGGFDAAEIRRRVTSAPALLVACLGLSAYARRGSGGWSMSADLVAYVLTRDRDGESRDTLSLALVAETLRQIGRAHWGAPERFGLPDPASLRATNLYGGDLDSVAVALWAVTWTQPFYLSDT